METLTDTFLDKHEERETVRMRLSTAIFKVDSEKLEISGQQGVGVKRDKISRHTTPNPGVNYYL